MAFKYTNPYSYPYPNPVYAQPSWYYQPTQTTVMQPTQATVANGGNLVKVNGIDGANAYPMGPNAEAVFLDANEDYMYYRRTDAGGFGKAVWFDFFPHAEEEPIEVEPKESGYVTREDFDRLAAKIDELMKPSARKAASDGK